jgi:hypothetical protein
MQIELERDFVRQRSFHVEFPGGKSGGVEVC